MPGARAAPSVASVDEVTDGITTLDLRTVAGPRADPRAHGQPRRAAAARATRSSRWTSGSRSRRAASRRSPPAGSAPRAASCRCRRTSMPSSRRVRGARPHLIVVGRRRRNSSGRGDAAARPRMETGEASHQHERSAGWISRRKPSASGRSRRSSSSSAGSPSPSTWSDEVEWSWPGPRYETLPVGRPHHLREVLAVRPGWNPFKVDNVRASRRARIRPNDVGHDSVSRDLRRRKLTAEPRAVRELRSRLRRCRQSP